MKSLYFIAAIFLLGSCAKNDNRHKSNSAASEQFTEKEANTHAKSKKVPTFSPSSDTEKIEFYPYDDQFELNDVLVTPGAGAVWDQTRLLLDITNASIITTLYFTTLSRSEEGTTVDLVYLSDTNGESLPDFKVKTPVTVKTSGVYKQEYFVIVPVQKSKVPVSAMLLVSDKNDSRISQKIAIRGMMYPGTKEKPISLGGVYWAPVNVGAGTSDASVLDKSSMGFVYQWGRNLPSLTRADGKTHTDMQAGPVSLAESTTETYKNKYITAANSPYDWLTPQDNTLWSGANNEGPCPPGWRLPTVAELTLIKNAYRADRFDATRHRLGVQGDNPKETLYFPASGHRLNSSGTSDSQGLVGDYWSSSVKGTGAYSLFFNASSSKIHTGARAYGLSCRCIKK